MESPFSAIKRGFDNTVANWPLLLIRIAENVVMVALIVGGILAVAIPIGLSGAFLDEIMIEEDPEALLNALLGTALLPVLLAFLVLTLIIVVVVAVHSFVQAGIVGVYVDGERQAPRAADTHRSRFKAFTPERWLEYGRRDWWPVFLIYNVIWGVWGLIVLLPLLAVAAALWLARDQPEAMLAVGCGGLVLVALLMIVTGFVVHLWSTVAIVLRSSGTPTTISIHEGWRVTVRRAVPLISIAVIAIVVSFAAASAIGMGAFGLGIISSIPGVGMLTIPMQIGVSFLQTAVSLVVSAWFLAAVVSVIISQ